MSFYPDQVHEHLRRPRNVGDVAEADAAGEAGSFNCGAILRLSLKIDDVSQTISEAKFKAAGCGYLIAAASVLTEIVEGLTTGEAARVAQEPNLFREWLAEFPAARTHCAALARETLLSIIKRYSDARRDEWHGDEALICTCFGVSERTIEREIQAGGLRTRKEVTRACLAGAGCGSCHILIEEMLDDYWRRAENFGEDFER